MLSMTDARDGSTPATGLITTPIIPTSLSQLEEAKRGKILLCLPASHSQLRALCRPLSNLAADGDR